MSSGGMERETRRKDASLDGARMHAPEQRKRNRPCDVQQLGEKVHAPGELCEGAQGDEVSGWRRGRRRLERCGGGRGDQTPRPRPALEVIVKRNVRGARRGRSAEQVSGSSGLALLRKRRRRQEVASRYEHRGLAHGEQAEPQRRLGDFERAHDIPLRALPTEAQCAELERDLRVRERGDEPPRERVPVRRYHQRRALALPSAPHTRRHVLVHHREHVDRAIDAPPHQLRIIPEHARGQEHRQRPQRILHLLHQRVVPAHRRSIALKHF